jgi:hypothetical protein
MTGYAGSIEKQTLENTYFRKVLFTGKHAQLVVIATPSQFSKVPLRHHGPSDGW